MILIIAPVFDSGAVLDVEYCLERTFSPREVTKTNLLECPDVFADSDGGAGLPTNIRPLSDAEITEKKDGK